MGNYPTAEADDQQQNRQPQNQLRQFARDRSLTQTLASASPQSTGRSLEVEHPHIDLIAAAFYAAFDRPVVTEAEYKRRKHEPLFAQAETLDLDKVADLSYEPAAGIFGDVYGESGVKIDICLKTLSGRRIPLNVGKDSLVEELKYLLEENEGIPVDHDRIVLLFDGKHMQDGKRISYYGVDDNSVIEFMPTLRASAPDVPLVLNNKLLVHRLDFDFSNMHDDGKEYYRGGRRYYRPYGWRRIALKVAGKYENDTWLGTGGIRTDSSPGEWPVSYHGTNKKNAESIAAKGYKLSKGKRFKYGKGIYSSPNIEVAEKYYAVKFNHGKRTYKVVFQNRVCPNELKIIPAEETQRGEYWVQPKDKLIRPYGICIKQVKS